MIDWHSVQYSQVLQQVNPDFKWQGWPNGTKNQNLKKSLDQKLTPQKSHAEFQSLKNLQKGKLFCLDFNRRTTGNRDLRALPQIFRLFWIAKKILLKSSHPKNTCHIYNFTYNHNMYKIANRMINMFPLINVEYCCQ